MEAARQMAVVCAGEDAIACRQADEGGKVRINGERALKVSRHCAWAT
jgi:hypothetical protein